MFRRIITYCFIFQGLVWSQRTDQDYKEELEAQNSAIQSLRNEIKATQKRIQSFFLTTFQPPAQEEVDRSIFDIQLY